MIFVKFVFLVILFVQPSLNFVSANEFYNSSQIFHQKGSIVKQHVYPDYKIELNLDNAPQRITSPGFPHEYYPPDTQVIYEIKMKLPDEIKQMSTRILLTFEMFVLEQSEFCSHDGLEIADSSGQVRVYCGSQVGRTILSEDSELLIRFFSNSEVESRGFSILLEMYNTECSQLFQGVNTGTFSTPNFPGRYYADDLCVWKIEASEGKRIKVKFDETFDIRAHEPLCVQDYLAVSLTGDFNTHIKRYCHGTRPVSMISSDNSILFKFRSDCCFEGKGFSASFMIIDSDEVTPTLPPEPKPNICSCGEENTDETERIMGGKTVEPPNRYPFMASLVKIKNGKDDFFCGGALIRRLYVITAAHCLDRLSPSDVRIALGAHNIDLSPDPVPVSDFVVHSGYNNRTLLNDIALVRLQDPVHLERTVRLACLPRYPQFTSPNDLARVAGWGSTNYKNKGPKELNEVELPIISNAECVSKYGGVIQDTNVCAGGEEGKDACSGDSGGPLFAKHDDKWHSVGVVSWGMSCGREGYPGIYTRVSEFLDWISNNIKDSPPCDGEEINPPVEPNLDNCGIPNSRDENRIAGGVEADPFEFPWMAMIVYNKTVVGVGTLISPNYVLTVASIFDTWMEWYPEVLDVFLGKHKVSGREETAKKFDVSAVYHHKGYGRPSPYNNDLALLKLTVPATGIYKPICMPRSDAWYPPNLEMKIAGWGRISNNGPGSKVLLKADLNILAEESCNKRYPGWFTDRMICAYKDGTDTCEGDTGAPLMRFYYGRYYLAGLSSWGSNEGCAIIGAPRVFSAVHSNLPWIHDMTGLEVA